MLSTSPYLRIARWVTIAALFTPLIVTPSLFFPFITGKALVFRALTELALFFLVLALLYPRPNEQRISLADFFAPLRHPVSISLIAFALISLLTALTGFNQKLALFSNFERGEGAWQILHYVLFFLLTLLLFRTKKEWVLMARVTIAVGCLVSLYALFQIPAVNDAFHVPGIIGAGPRVSGTLGNATYIGTYLLFSLFWIVWLFREWKSQLARIGLVLIGIFEFIMLAYSGTRGAFLGLSVATIILCSRAALRRLRPFEFKKSITRNFALWILLMIVLLPITIFLTRGAPLWGKIPIVERQLRAAELMSINTRLWTWGSALRGIRERPFLGWGAENFTYVFDTYYNPRHYGLESWFDRAHNVFLDYAISGGVLLVGAFLAIFISFFAMLRRTPKHTTKPLIAAMGVAYLAQGLTLFDVLSIYISLYLFLAFSIRALFFDFQEPIPKKEEGRLARTPIRYSLTILTSVGVAAALYTTNYLPLKENRLIIGALRAQNTDIQTSFILFDTALRLPSPVGMIEARGQLAAFSVTYVRQLLKRQLEIAPESLKALVAFNNQWFDRILQSQEPLSSKELYMIGVLNSESGLLAKDREAKQQYFNQAKAYLEYGLGQAPTRIELIAELAKIAVFENNTKAEEGYIARLNALRPDLFPTTSPRI